MLGCGAARVTIVLAGLAIASAISGCSHTQRAGQERPLRIALTEYRINPQHAIVTAGPLTIVAHNFGRLTHNLSLSHDGQPSGSTKPIAPGQSVELTVSVVRGTYVMASTILDDQALGDYGTLEVR